ncbi:MAG: putative manganese-dependent inorganic diphosphatase [Coprococcus sp.]
MSKEKEIFVIGHKNPDTDSICSAIAYAYLKNQMTESSLYVPKRAGDVNTETQYVLERFGYSAPEYVCNVRTQVRDAGLTEGERVKPGLSVKKAWEILSEKHRSTLAVVDDNGGLKGLITIGDIAKSIMDVYGGKALSDAKTPYSNIVETLQAEVLAGDIDNAAATGKVIIAAANPDLMEDSIEPGDMVILGDRYESQLCAIEMQAGCLIVCLDSEVSDSIRELAREKGCKILRTSYDTFITARLLNQSIPIEYFMIRSNLTYFRLDDYIEDIRGIMGKMRHREFPVLDSDGKLAGMMTRHSLLEMDKKRVILVDHNETGQAVDGIQESEIEEIVDHHKLGFVETMRPVMFRNQPVGCTSTIIYLMFKEQNIEIPAGIAGLMCSAIVSDTLLYRSPTCTAIDRIAAEDLAKIAGINTEEHAKAMFAAGSNLGSKTSEEIFYQDFKKFKAGEKAYGIGQITSMDGGELAAIVERLTDYMEEIRPETGLDMLFFMLTDILKESTSLICVGPDALQMVAEYSGCPVQGSTVYMEGVVSRKKQIVPTLMQAIQ